MQLASNGQRFINMLVDNVAAIVFAGITGAVIGFASVLMGGGENNPLLEGGIGQVIGIVAVCAYYIAFEALTGRTLGKLVTGTKVVSMDGRAPSFGQIVGRTLARFLPFEPFSFFGSMPGWHDGLSRTRVIRTR